MHLQPVSRFTAVLILALGIGIGIGGCTNAEEEVAEAARAEMGCTVIATKFIRSEGSRDTDRELWLAEGCGRVRYYTCTRCNDTDDFECKATSERDLPKPPLSSF